MQSIFISVGAGGSNSDRECEEEAYTFRTVDLLGCMELEVRNLGQAWTGSCEEDRGATMVAWHVDLEQIQPEPSPR